MNDDGPPVPVALGIGIGGTSLPGATKVALNVLPGPLPCLLEVDRAILKPRLDPALRGDVGVLGGVAVGFHGPRAAVR